MTWYKLDGRRVARRRRRWAHAPLILAASHFYHEKRVAWVSISIYIITQVILAFSLVPAYDLLEDRRTIDEIVTKFFPSCFEMEERFENLDNSLRDWAKDKVQKSLAEALNRFEKPAKRKIKPFLLENDTEIIF